VLQCGTVSHNVIFLTYDSHRKYYSRIKERSLNPNIAKADASVVLATPTALQHKILRVRAIRPDAPAVEQALPVTRRRNDVNGV